MIIMIEIGDVFSFYIFYILEEKYNFGNLRLDKCYFESIMEWN